MPDDAKRTTSEQLQRRIAECHEHGPGWCSDLAAELTNPLEREFVEASVAVWREIDRLDAEPGGYRGMDESTALRIHEREAWERYRDGVLDVRR